MSLTNELDGNSLSDCRLTGEFLELERGRLFELLLPFSPPNLNFRESPFLFIEAGFRVARISERLNRFKPSQGLYVSEKTEPPNVGPNAKNSVIEEAVVRASILRPTLIKKDWTGKIVSINLLLGSSVRMEPNFTAGMALKF